MADEQETVTGEVIDTRTLADAESEFQRAIQNRLEFRNLAGGTYKLVRIDSEEDDD